MGFFSKVFKAITGAIGDVIGWVTGIEEPDFEDTQRGFLVNKQSNDAAIPVIYGERKIGGTRVFVSTSGDKNKYLYIALVLCEGEVQSIGDVYINDTISTDSKFSGLVTIEKFTGTDAQTYSTVLAQADDTWGANHRLRGVAYLAVKLQYSQDVFSGMPTIECIVQGRKVYDPRTAATAYSTNPALCLRDFLTNPRYGKGLASALIDDDSFVAAANTCDTLVTRYTGAGSNQKLFECNAIIDTSNKLFDNVKRILSGMRGLMPYSNGIYSLIIEKDESSTFDLTAANITSDIQLTSANKNKKYNKVVVKFVNPDANWQTDSVFWPPAGSSEETAFLTADNDQELSTEVTLNTITNYYSARDIARIICLASRENELTANLTATSEAFAMAVGDVCRLEHESMGWTGASRQLFRVSAMQLMESGEAKLTLQQYTSTIYPWAEGTEAEVNQESTLPDPLDIAAPTGLSVTESTYLADDGTVFPALFVSFTNESGFAISYEVQWRTGANDYQSALTSVEQYEIKGIETGQNYDVRVRAINTLGVRSAFVSTSSTADGDTTAPGIPTGVAATGGLREVTISWVKPTDTDFSFVEIWENTADDSAGASKVATSGGDHFVRTGLGYDVTRYYWVKSVDYTGNTSEFSSSAFATTLQVGSDAFTQDVLDLIDDAGNVKPVGSLPASGVDGEIVFLTTTNALYRWDTGATNWVPAVDAAVSIENGTITGNKVVANTITGGLLATAGIITNSAQIDNLVVTGAKISNGAITNAKIGTAAVDTLKIAGQAVTIPSSSYTEADFTVTRSNDGTWHDIASVTYTSTGNSAIIIATCLIKSKITVDFEDGTRLWASIRITDSSSNVIYYSPNILDVTRYNSNEEDRVSAALSLIDTPLVGTETYTMQFYGEVYNESFVSIKASNRAITVLEVKR